MEPLAIIEYLQVIKEGQVDLGMGEPVLAMNEFGFKGAEERFHGGIVVAVSGGAHAGEDAVTLEELTVISAGVLAAAVGMVEQACGRSAMVQSAFQGVLDQRGFEMIGGGPADDFAAGRWAGAGHSLRRLGAIGSG